MLCSSRNRKRIKKEATYKILLQGLLKLREQTIRIIWNQALIILPNLALIELNKAFRVNWKSISIDKESQLFILSTKTFFKLLALYITVLSIDTKRTFNLKTLWILYMNLWWFYMVLSHLLTLTINTIENKVRISIKRLLTL